MSQTDETNSGVDSTQSSPEQEELRQRAIDQLDEQMRILGDHCAEVTQLFEKIIALEEDLGIKILRGKLNQDSVGYTGALKLRSNLFRRRSSLHTYSLEELLELVNQVIIIGDGITAMHTIFEKHFNLINERKESLVGKSLREQLESVRAQAEITKSFTTDVITNGETLSRLRTLTGESILDTVARNRSKILSTAALMGALALGGAAKSCDGCNPSDDPAPAKSDNEIAYVDQDLME